MITGIELNDDPHGRNRSRVAIVGRLPKQPELSVDLFCMSAFGERLVCSAGGP